MSTYSAGTGNCVEVGTARGGIVVRDTKDRDGGALKVSPVAWRTFVAGLSR